MYPYSADFSGVERSSLAVSESDDGSTSCRSARKSTMIRMGFRRNGRKKRSRPCVILSATLRTFLFHESPNSTISSAHYKFDIVVILSPVASSRYVGTTGRLPRAAFARFTASTAGRRVFRIQRTCFFAYCRVDIFILSMASAYSFSRLGASTFFRYSENSRYPAEPMGKMGTCMEFRDRKSTRLNSSHSGESRMPSSA